MEKGRSYRDLPIMATIPGRREEMMLNDPKALPIGSVQRQRGDPIYFESRRGRPMRYVVNFEAVMNDTLRAFPGDSGAQPNIDAMRGLLLTLCDVKGDYLVKNIPLTAVLMNSATRNNRSKWWNYLPVDWEQSFVTSTFTQNCWVLLRIVYATPPQ